MNATIISVGNELLIGKTTNTNLIFLAKTLREIGIDITKASCIQDDKNKIHQTLRETDDELIIFTGGLGPTHDDITKESVCSFYELPLVKHEASYQKIKSYFERNDRPMKAVNEKQAYFPKEAIILENHNGTAPGTIIKTQGKIVVLLPGPPTELKPMFAYVKTYLKERTDKKIYQSGYLIAGVGESDIEEDLMTIFDKYDDVNIAPYAGLGSIQYIFTSLNPDSLEKALSEFKKTFYTYIVGPYDQTIEERIVDTLIARGKTISFAESCTAGLAAARLVNVPDVSKVFKESYVLYSNEAKIKQLGINQMIIEKFGAVSDQCVYELAYQLAQRTDSDITLSISGVAGPSGGTALKPVGTVYFGLYYQGKTHTYHKVFAGDRYMIRQKATTYGLYLVLQALMHEDNHS